ncbi:MAG: hypothetical protein JXO51_08320 [Candidatus Aminicenantes bacterium]|nr:hypothetical protein [Candidatus Aminicenantes bacterium]
MRRRRVRESLWWVLLLVPVALLLILFPLRTRKQAEAENAVDTAIEGLNLTYFSFDRNNRKKLEVRCRESQKKGADLLEMRGVTATIFDVDKLEKDIHVSATTGSAGNNFNDFLLQGQARIESADFSLSSPSFALKDLDILTSRDKVDFALKDVQGHAARGLRYYIRQRSLKLFACRGVWTRDGQPYDFRSRIFWVIQKKGKLILEKEARVTGDGSELRAQWITLQFDAEFSQLQMAVAIGNCFFRAAVSGEDGRSQEREISANLIKMLYDPQGRLQRLEVHGDGQVALATGAESGRLRSEAIEITLDAASQNLERVRTTTRGELVSRGRENADIRADSLLAEYGSDGVLDSVRAEGGCEFRTDAFSGTSSRMHHDAANSLIEISGREAAVASRRNTFRSSRFLLRTRLKQLSSDREVKATLIPEKKSILLGARPVFVTAGGLDLSDGGKDVCFKGKVSLFQDEVELQAGELHFSGGGESVAGSAGVDLNFPENGETLRLRGKTITLEPQGPRLVIDGEGRLRQGENSLSAGRIEMSFDRNDRLDTIAASGRVNFTRKDVSGRSQRLDWNYVGQTVWFRDSAEITRQGAGTTRGQELRFDLKSSQITVSGSGERSETTIGPDRT